MEAHSVLPSTGLQAPAGSQPLLSRVPGIGLQTWDQSTARSSLMMGWFPCAAAVLGSPNAQGKPAQHIHLPLGGRTAPGKARSGRRVPGIGLQTWDQSNCPELTDHGLVPLRYGCAREPKRKGEARTAHPPASRREDSSREGLVWQALSGHKRSNTQL